MNKDDSTPDIATKMTFLDVPYERKEEAKAAGATWHRKAKRWKVDAGVDLTRLRTFLPQNNRQVPQPALDSRAEFTAFAEEAGLVIDDLVADGELHRVQTTDGKTGSRDGAYIFEENDGYAGGFVQNFRSGFKSNWKAVGQKLSAAQVQALEERNAQKRAERNAQIQATHEKTAIVALTSFNDADSSRDHEYLAKKQVKGPAARFGAAVDDEGRLLIPLRDMDGTIWGLQRISSSGFKQFLPGGRVKGLFHVIEGNDSPESPLLVTTGFGTGAAIHAATGKTVFCAMSDNNLKDLVRQLAEREPDKSVVICADNDTHLIAEGKANVGLDAALDARISDRCHVVYPEFGGKQGRSHTDFADLLRDSGPNTVAAQIRATQSRRHGREQE